MESERLQMTSSMAEWKEYAKLLDEIADKRMELLDALSGDVPKNVHDAGWDKMQDGEIQLRSDLEDRMAKEHPKEWDVDVFY